MQNSILATFNYVNYSDPKRAKLQAIAIGVSVKKVSGFQTTPGFHGSASLRLTSQSSSHALGPYNIVPEEAISPATRRLRRESQLLFGRHKSLGKSIMRRTT